MIEKKLKQFKIVALVFLVLALSLAAGLVVWLSLLGWNFFAIKAPLVFFILIFSCGVCFLVCCLCFVKVLSLTEQKAATVYCPSCGGENSEKNAYCSACGVKLLEGKEE